MISVLQYIKYTSYTLLYFIRKWICTSLDFVIALSLMFLLQSCWHRHQENMKKTQTFSLSVNLLIMIHPLICKTSEMRQKFIRFLFPTCFRVTNNLKIQRCSMNFKVKRNRFIWFSIQLQILPHDKSNNGPIVSAALRARSTSRRATRHFM